MFFNSQHYSRDQTNLTSLNKAVSIFILFLAIGLLFYSCKSTKKRSKKGNYGQVQKQKKQKQASGSDKVEKVIASARSYTGTRYKMGGSTRAGMDCSGLMSVAFSAADISLPRTSAEQSKKGMAVALDDLREGDLIFFTDKKGHKTITHVGMVTEVKGKDNIKFIHSSTKLGVVEDNLFAPYYISIFVKAVRLF